MYKTLIRHKVRSVFASLSSGETGALVQALRPDALHTFPGNGPLGGYHSDREAVRAWFDRLGRLLPGQQFQVEALTVDGSPWNTEIGVLWTATSRLLDGGIHTATGTAIVRVRWTRVTALQVYVHNPSALDDALRRQAAFGLTEALAPPIRTPRRDLCIHPGEALCLVGTRAG